jgi:hypothetical protein
MRVRRDIAGFRLMVVHWDDTSECIFHSHSPIESSRYEFIIAEITSLFAELGHWGLQVMSSIIHWLHFPILVKRWSIELAAPVSLIKALCLAHIVIAIELTFSSSAFNIVNLSQSRG